MTAGSSRGKKEPRVGFMSKRDLSVVCSRARGAKDFAEAL